MLTNLLHDTNFWVLISFIIFIGVFIKYGKNKVLNGLDDKISEIQKELQTAETLRVEAQEILAEYQRKQKDALNEAEKIVADAALQAKMMQDHAEQEWQKTMSRREEQLNERLLRIENNARNEIETYTARLAVNSTRKVLQGNLSAKSEKSLLEDTLKQVSSKIN
jgi:F-type H+-transporting ATPase subunit b